MSAHEMDFFISYSISLKLARQMNVDLLCMSSLLIFVMYLSTYSVYDFSKLSNYSFPFKTSLKQISTSRVNFSNLKLISKLKLKTYAIFMTEIL